MKVDLSNKVAVITGAAGGIGQGISRIFAQNGANVVINDTNEEKGLEFLKEINKIGKKAIFVKANVGNLKEAESMMGKVIKEFGKIDILINNAGINVDGEDRQTTDLFSEKKWEELMNVDLDGVFFCSKAALKYMVKNNYGKIINISSVVGLVPFRNQCAFAAAKAGAVNLTKAMAIEMAKFNINVNAIAPGSIDIPTTRASQYFDGKWESLMSHIPLKRPGKAEDIGYAALYLVSDVANYVTGSVLVVDGGWTCGFGRDW
jgi:3-oxoacyl-[acyl-carrier protein] reductase